MHIGLFLDLSGNIRSHVSFQRIFIYSIHSINLVSLFVNEKPLWGTRNKLCMLVCTLIRELLHVLAIQSLFAAKS